MKVINTLKTGQNLRRLAAEHGYTAIQLSRKLGFCEDSIFKWFAGTNIPKIDTLVMLSELFNTPIDELLVCDMVA